MQQNNDCSVVSHIVSYSVKTVSESIAAPMKRNFFGDYCRNTGKGFSLWCEKMKRFVNICVHC